MYFEEVMNELKEFHEVDFGDFKILFNIEKMMPILNKLKPYVDLAEHVAMSNMFQNTEMQTIQKLINTIKHKTLLDDILQLATKFKEDE